MYVSEDGYDGLQISLVQVGEEKIVLDLGQSVLQHPNAKPYVHDFLLSMALAEVRWINKEVRNKFQFYGSFALLHFLIVGAFFKCAIAKICFEKNKVSQGFEALARAQCLLRSNISLGKMPLLSQVMLLSFMWFWTCSFQGSAIHLLG